MTTTNGFLSSDDGLLLDALTGQAGDPPAFEFQSELTDDDAPDPLTLDEIANASLAALTNGLRSQAEKETYPRPVAADWKTNGNGGIKARTKTRRDGIKIVDIEVPLPWLPPVQRAAFKHVVVEDYQAPREDEYRRARRKRRGVSHIFHTICLNVGDHRVYLISAYKSLRWTLRQGRGWGVESLRTAACFQSLFNWQNMAK
jgi:hypothetical protein